MPLYEYQCDSCKKLHEVIQKFSDAPLKECPDCHGSMRKLMSATSFSLKGSGWYSTDYKKSAPKKEEAAPAGASSPEPKASSEKVSELKVKESAPTTKETPVAEKKISSSTSKA